MSFEITIAVFIIEHGYCTIKLLNSKLNRENRGHAMLFLGWGFGDAWLVVVGRELVFIENSRTGL